MTSLSAPRQLERSKSPFGMGHLALNVRNLSMLERFLARPRTYSLQRHYSRHNLGLKLWQSNLPYFNFFKGQSSLWLGESGSNSYSKLRWRLYWRRCRRLLSKSAITTEKGTARPSSYERLPERQGGQN
eukprot:6175825-Pleurochrysis_carterae.AAC.3